jgi:hypothetical protein
LEELKQKKGCATVTLPPSCSSYPDGRDLIIKVKTLHIIDGDLVCYYIIWSDEKISLKCRGKTVTLLRQKPPNHFVTFSQETFDGILNVSRKMWLCHGYETHELDLDDSKLIVEGWTSLIDPDKIDCRTRNKSCEMIKFSPSQVRVCNRCRKKAKRVLEKRQGVLEDRPKEVSGQVNNDGETVSVDSSEEDGQ